MKKILIILLFFTLNSFSQEYEIAWEKEIGGTYAQFSKDGEFFYVAGGNTISKYRSSDGSFVSTFDYGSNQILTITNNVYISPSGNYLLTIGALGNQDGNLYIWDLKTEKVFKIIKDVKDAEMSFDDSKLYYVQFTKSQRSTIITLDLKTNTNTSKTFNNIFSLIKISHNSKILATVSHSSETGGKYYLTLWDIETLTEIKRFELEGNEFTTFTEIKFSFDNKYVGVSSLGPHKATIIDIPQLKEYYNSTMVSNFGIGRFGFLNNHFIFNYNNFNSSDYNVYFVNNQNLKLDQNLKTITSTMTTSSNGLIFTKYSLLKPKTVGVTEQKTEITLITPNPASDYIYINVETGLRPVSNNPASIEIFNIFGVKIPPRHFALQNATPQEGNFKIDVSNLAPGVYFIKIGDKFEKFVKL